MSAEPELERGLDRGVVLFDLDGTIIEPAVATLRANYEGGAVSNSYVYDGVGDLISMLADEGRTVAIAASKPARLAERILIHHGIRPDITFVGGVSMECSRTDKTDVIAHTLSELGHPDPDDVVMVGDRAVDITGGNDHGLATIGVGWGYGEPGELSDARPTAQVDSAEQLARVLGAGTRGETWRRAGRCLVIDRDDRVLLLRWQPDATGIWVSPGGGCDPGERFDEAARRELAEELGRTDLELGELIFTRRFPFNTSKQGYAGQREAWYLVRTDHFDPGDVATLPGAAEERLTTARWWSLDEMAAPDEDLFPQHLADAVATVIDPAWDGLAFDISQTTTAWPGRQRSARPGPERREKR